MSRFVSSIDIDAKARTGEHDDGLPLTEAEVRVLEAMLSASTLAAPHPHRCRASKTTETRHPWNHTVHSRTAQRLHKRGLAFDHLVPELHALGNDGYTIWYSISPGGRAALRRAKCGSCGGTGRVATDPTAYDQGRVECPTCRDPNE